MQTIILGAVALGILWSIMTSGVYITYKILDTADMTAEGSLVLGASVAAVLIAGGVNPYFATVAAFGAGMVSGLVTAFFHIVMKIPPLLSGILSMLILYSVNIRVMKGSNVHLLRMKAVFTLFEDLGLSKQPAAIAGGLFFTGIALVFIYKFFATEVGFAIRATGNNPAMAKAQGIDIDKAKTVGYALSNGLVALGGGLIGQYLGFSDVQMGTGAIVIGLASLIIGEVLFAKNSFVRTLASLVIGAVAYRIIIALVFEAGMPSTDLKMFTALTVALALYIPELKKKLKRKNTCKEAEHANAYS